MARKSRTFLTFAIFLLFFPAVMITSSMVSRTGELSFTSLMITVILTGRLVLPPSSPSPLFSRAKTYSLQNWYIRFQFSHLGKIITLHDRITSNENVITWKVNRSELGGSRSKFGSFTKRIPVSMSILKNVVVISRVYPSMAVSF